MINLLLILKITRVKPVHKKLQYGINLLIHANHVQKILILSRNKESVFLVKMIKSTMNKVKNASQNVKHGKFI